MAKRGSPVTTHIRVLQIDIEVWVDFNLAGVGIVPRDHIGAAVAQE